MKTIKNNIETLIEIKNSKFITILYKINDNFDLENILNEVKEKYPKATHYCYAYRLINKEKSSDDGEPGGTAGLPMLNVLIKEDLVNVLAITVRYFGGIKLGAGGLVRAYTKSLTTSIQESTIINLKEGYLVKLNFPYTNQKQIDYILKDINILNKEYNDDITYTIEIDKDNLNLLENYNYEILETKLIEDSK